MSSAYREVDIVLDGYCCCSRHIGCCVILCCCYWCFRFVNLLSVPQLSHFGDCYCLNYRFAVEVAVSEVPGN